MSPQRPHIDSLPNELLAEVFKLGSKNYRFGLHHDMIYMRDARRLPNEVLYSHVSRRWRDVATNLPTLWTTIHVILHSSLFWLPHYLSRSQYCHLNIWINHFGLDDDDLEDTMNKVADIMNLLLPHINRWSSLHVEGLYEPFAYLVLSRLENLSAPVLRELTVHFEVEAGVEWMEENSVPFEILQGDAPLLTSIHLDTLLYCQPPVSALTTCSIYQSYRPAACMRFIRGLAASHALTTLCVHGHAQSQNSGEFAGTSLTRLESLKSLWLDGTSSFTSTLLLAISAPHLETLRLRKVKDDDLRLLFDSSYRSRVEFPALHTMSLGTVQLDNDSYIELSRMFPSITHLKIKGVFPNDFRRLAQLIGAPRHLHETDARDTSDGRRVTADIIWPKLRNLNIGSLRLRDVDNASHDLLVARRELGRPIEKLVLADKVFEMEGMGRLGDREHPSHDES